MIGCSDARAGTSAVARTMVSAAAATVPTILGGCFGYASIGLTASFGSYLIAVTHTTLPKKKSAQRLVITVLMLSSGALAGAAAGTRPMEFLLLAVFGAVWQAWTEAVDTGLRLPAAMAVLAMLLSTGNVSGDVPVGPYGAAFSAGAVWQALVQYIVARRLAAPDAGPAAEFAVVFSAATAFAARWFITLMATLAIVAGGIVLALPLPHAAWLLTAALRVMKPSQGETLRRLGQRLVGTVAGAVCSVGLLGWPLPTLLHAGILGAVLSIMLLVGAKRYAVWTFCLTVIALDLGQRPNETGWQTAEYRSLLTIVGLALALVFTLCRPSADLPQLSALWRWWRMRRN